jgi:ElaB/YqjD/DUF883 family membrane-anchored ribosome-binding protein
MSPQNPSSDRPRDRKAIEAEIRDTRARLDDNLRALEDKLSPQHLVDETFAYFRDGGPNEFARNLGDSVKQNPTPFLLTTVGLGWLMLSQNKARPTDAKSRSNLTQNASQAASSARDKAATAQRKAERAGQKASDKAGAIKDTVADRGNQLQDNSRAVVNQASRQARATGNQAIRFIEDNPLSAGAIGIAIGAVLGGLTPSSAVEDEQLGDLRDRVVDKASDVGLEQAQKAQAKVEEKSEQVKKDAPESTTSRSGSRAKETGSAAGVTAAAQSAPESAATGAPGDRSKTSCEYQRFLTRRAGK